MDSGLLSRTGLPEEVRECLSTEEKLKIVGTHDNRGDFLEASISVRGDEATVVLPQDWGRPFLFTGPLSNPERIQTKSPHELPIVAHNIEQVIPILALLAWRGYFPGIDIDAQVAELGENELPIVGQGVEAGDWLPQIVIKTPQPFSRKDTLRLLRIAQINCLPVKVEVDPDYVEGTRYEGDPLIMWPPLNIWEFKEGHPCKLEVQVEEVENGREYTIIGETRGMLIDDYNYRSKFPTFYPVIFSARARFTPRWGKGYEKLLEKDPEESVELHHLRGWLLINDLVGRLPVLQEAIKRPKGFLDVRPPLDMNILHFMWIMHDVGEVVSPLEDVAISHPHVKFLKPWATRLEQERLERLVELGTIPPLTAQLFQQFEDKNNELGGQYPLEAAIARLVDGLIGIGVFYGHSKKLTTEQYAQELLIRAKKIRQPCNQMISLLEERDLHFSQEDLIRYMGFLNDYLTKRGLKHIYVKHEADTGERTLIVIDPPGVVVYAKEGIEIDGYLDEIAERSGAK